MAFTYVTIVETFETAGDVAARGTVTFTPIAQMHNGVAIVAAPEVATLDSSGSIAKRIAATTDPGTTPVGVTYRVDERIVGQPIRTYYKAVPHDQGATLELSTLPTAAEGVAVGGFALRGAVDYDDSVAPSDGQVMTWDGATGKFHPEAGGSGGGGGAVSSVNGLSGAVTLTPSGLGAQPVDSDLTAIAALDPADGSLLSRQSGAWAARSGGQVKADLSLDQVNNTADIAKPVSNATSTALAGKAALSHTHTVGNLVTTGSPGPSTFLRGDGVWAAVAGSSSSTGPVTLVAVSGVLTPNATLGGLFRYDASTDVTLAEPTGGANGQPIEVQVYAAGGDRVLTVAGTAVTIPSGRYWWGHYSYDSVHDTWILDDSGGGSGGGGTTADATTSVKGVTRLMGGTADAPTVPWTSVTGAPTIPAGSTVEDIQDAAATLLTTGSHTGVAAVYDDPGNRVNLTVSGGAATPTAHPSDPTVYSFGATSATPATVPGAPTITSVTPGSGQVTVVFTAPASNGGAAVSSYTATASTGQTATGPSSPLVISGLPNGTAVTVTVRATNSAGTGAASAASSSVTPVASTAGSSSPGTSTPARWWIPFGGAPHCRVTYDTGVVSGQAQVVWVASMPDVRARTSKLETGVAAQTQDAWQAYVMDLSTGATVADSGTVLGTASSWTATTLTPVAGRRYKGFARVRATDGQWSPYSSTRFVAPTGVTRFFEDFGMVGDGTTRSGTDYGATPAIFSGPLRTAISACNPGDVLKSNAPGTTVTASVSGTALTSSTSVFNSGMVGKKVMVYAAGSKTTATNAYVHRTTISAFTSGTAVTLAAAAPTAVTNTKAVIGYPEFWVGHIDMDGGANSQGGVTIDGSGCLFTSLDPDHAGFRTSGITDMTYKNIHYWVKNVTIRGNGQNNNNCPWFTENPATTGGRIIGCYAEHSKDAGIMFFGSATDWHVVDCTADHTMADPFHVTGSAADIQFIRNLGIYVGDDGTANIGYRTDGDAARPQRITWESPTIFGQDWGRGLSFGGVKDALATDVTIDRGAGASFLIGSDGDQANTDHVQVRRFTVTNPKTRAGQHPTYTQGGGTTATVNDDATIKLLNIGSTVRQSNILIEDGTITDPGFAVQVVVSGTAGFQDGTVIIRGVSLTGAVNTGTGWRDDATWSSHIDLRGITAPAASTPAPAPTAANS